MEAMAARIGDVQVHAVPQTLSVEDFRQQLQVATGSAGGDDTDVLIAHVALTSLPARLYPDINELEVEEAAFDRRFDVVMLGHYHVHQKVSPRSWYAGSTDAFSFADRPSDAGPKGILVLDTDRPSVEVLDNPHERPLVTISVQAASMGPGELVDAVERAAAGAPTGSIVRVFLDDVDASAFRQVGPDQFHEAVPGALHVQVEAQVGAESFAVQGAIEIRSLEQEWIDYVEHQDLAGLDRDRVVATGRGFLEAAKGDLV
jgi:DNA repair exonuclease SbcCD nuclease subunit